MSRHDREITESDLHAYVDGAAGGADREAVEDYLSRHPAKAEEIEAWRLQNEALRALYAHVGAEPVPPHLSPRRIAHALRRESLGWKRLAAAAVLFLTIGGTAGWFGRDLLAPSPASANLAERAIAAHAIYVSEVRHPVEVWADERDHLQNWLSKRLDRALTVPDLRAHGLDLVGGRLLPSANGPAAQFMYEDEAGSRVTLYVVPAQDGPETSFHFVTLDQLEALFWTDQGISCALVGDVPRGKLQEIATHAYEQLG